MHRCIAELTFDDYLAALTTAWDLAHQKAIQQIEADEAPTAIIDCIRYALIATSLNNVAESYVPELVARAVETGLWTPERALSIAAHISDEQRRAAMYGSLLATGKLDATQITFVKTSALNAAQSIPDEWSRAFALEHLAGQIQDEQQDEAQEAALGSALQSADGDFGGNTHTLWSLIKKLDGVLLENARQRVPQLKNAEARAWALSALAKRFSGEIRQQLLADGLDSAIEISDELNRANALSQLANQLDGSLVSRGLEAVLAMQDGRWRPRAVEGLLDKLDQEQLEQLLDNMLITDEEWGRANVILTIATRSSGKLRKRALIAAFELETREAPMAIMLHLGGSVNSGLLQDAIVAAQEISNEEIRAKRLSWLKRIEENQKAVLDISGAEDIQENEVTERELESTLRTDDEEDRSRWFSQLVPRLPKHLLSRAVEGAKAIEDKISRDFALAALAKRLSGDLLTEALEVSFSVEEKSTRSSILQKIAHQMNNAQKEVALNYALETVRSIRTDWQRIDSLVGLLGDLEGQQKAEVVKQALETAQSLKNREFGARMLACIVRDVEGQQRTEVLTMALEAVQTYRDTSEIMHDIGASSYNHYFDENTQKSMATWGRIRILAIIIGYLDEPQKTAVLTQSMESIFAIPSEEWRLSALREIARYLEGERLEQAFESILTSSNIPQAVEALVELVNKLSDEQLARAMDFILKIDEPIRRGRALLVIRKQLNGEPKNEILTQVFQIALEAKDDTFRLGLLKGLAAQGFVKAVDHGVEIASSLTDEPERTRGLISFLPYVEDQTPFLRQIRLGIFTQLRTFKNAKRESLFWYLFDEELFGSPVVPADIMSGIADQVIEVCRDWRWV
jgi:hypothetical protein